MNDDLHWEISEEIDPDNGAVTLFFKYKGMPCHVVELNTGIAKTIAGYKLIEKDLRSISSWWDYINSVSSPNGTSKFSLAQDANGDKLIKPVFIACITFYAKCFASCKGRKLKLEKANIDEKFHKVHKLIMHMRNEYAAHSGESKLETSGVLLVFPQDESGPFNARINTPIIQPEGYWNFEHADPSFNDLVKHLQDFCNSKVKILAKKLMDDYVLHKGKDYWYEIAKKS